MITIEKSIKHMAWSNQEIFSALTKLPQDIYPLTAAEGEWNVGRILRHFIVAAEWYCFLLAGRAWTDVPAVAHAEDLERARMALGELDLLLIAAVSDDDAEIAYQDDDGNEKRTTRSMVLAQAVAHTAEHKGQLATILKVHGIDFNLDQYDLWSYEAR
jgi:uncharacterized damage-inducible protein DinB